MRKSGAAEVSASQAVFPSLQDDDGEQQDRARGKSGPEKRLEGRMVVSDSSSEDTAEVNLDSVIKDRRKFSKDKKVNGKEGKRKKRQK